eukprot:scaffold56443_cov65-Phaeocystis_antarctica.AAC.4
MGALSTKREFPPRNNHLQLDHANTATPGSKTATRTRTPTVCATDHSHIIATLDAAAVIGQFVAAGALAHLQGGVFPVPHDSGSRVRAAVLGQAQVRGREVRARVCQHKAELARGRGPAREHLQVGREPRAGCAPAGRMLERCQQEGRSARVCAVAEQV